MEFSFHSPVKLVFGQPIATALPAVLTELVDPANLSVRQGSQRLVEIPVDIALDEHVHVRGTNRGIPEIGGRSRQRMHDTE